MSTGSAYRIGGIQPISEEGRWGCPTHVDIVYMTVENRGSADIASFASGLPGCGASEETNLEEEVRDHLRHVYPDPAFRIRAGNIGRLPTRPTLSSG